MLRIGITKKIFPRPKFEAIAEKYISGKALKLIMFAYRLAKYGHQGKKREVRLRSKKKGQLRRKLKREILLRYFDHVKGVALILMLELGIYNTFIIIVGLLHDIEEESFIMNLWDIEKVFGKRVSKAVESLTKIKGEDYYQKLENTSWRIKIIKLCDRLHNLRTLPGCSKKKIRKQLKETREFYIPFADRLIKEAPKEYKSKVEYLLEEMKWACKRAEKYLY